jgi:hypothetical protein
MIKVNNSFAPYTPKMVVWLEICVEPFRIAGTFNNKSGFNFAQSSQRSINSIQGYTQKNLRRFLRGVRFLANRIKVAESAASEGFSLAKKVLDEISADKQIGQDKNDTVVKVIVFSSLKELTI